MSEALLGTRIDTWRLEAVLGAGGVGTVFAARDATGKRVALKLLHRELVDKAHVRARFFREAELAQKLSHPAIVRVIGSGTCEDGTPYLISELVEGPSLEDLRNESGGRLDIDLVQRVAIALLDALAHAHARGIVHRDVKPANVMLAADDSVRVLDFGLARVLEVDLAQGVTSADSVIGTAGFMAPEQAQGRWDLIDARTDLWAVGATLLKLAADIDVHEGQTVQENLALAATRGVERLAERAPHLSPQWIAVLERALAFRREDRFADAETFRDAIVRPSPLNPTVNANVAPASRAVRNFMVPILLVIAAAVIGFVALTYRAEALSPRPALSADVPRIHVASALVAPSLTAVTPSALVTTPPTSPPGRRDLPATTTVTRRSAPAPTATEAPPPATAAPSISRDPLDIRR